MKAQKPKPWLPKFKACKKTCLHSKRSEFKLKMPE